MIEYELANEIAENKMFEGIDFDVIESLPDNMFHVRYYSAGNIIIEQNSVTSGVYLIGKGHVRIINQLNEDESLEIGKSSSGEFIGEMSLIENKKTSAGVVCSGNVKAIYIKKENFFELLRLIPKIYFNITKTISERLRRQLSTTGDVVEKAKLLIELNKKISAQKAELEKLNKELGQKNSEILSQQKKIIELEQKNTALAMGLTANHEINQPLSVIKSQLGLLVKSLGIDKISDKQFQIINKIKSSSEKIQKILDKFSGSGSFRIDKYSGGRDMIVFDEPDEKKKED